jgi:Ca-activated chloride channel family protein
MTTLLRLFDLFMWPGYFVLLLLPILFGTLVLLRRPSHRFQPLTGHPGGTRMPMSWRTAWVSVRPWVQITVLTLLVITMARPVGGKIPIRSQQDAIDIVLVMDVSSSMRDKDKSTNTTRIEAARRFATQFTDGRDGDRLALVTFARFSRVMAPLTFDREAIKRFIRRMQTVRFSVEDGTAIGIGLGTGVRRLRESEAKSKVIILLTDGRNNIGAVTPEESAELAAKEGVRVYTILAWGDPAMRPSPAGGEASSSELERIAVTTGGRFFRVSNAEALTRVGKEIDALERTPVETIGVHAEREFFHLTLIPALLLLLLGVLMDGPLVRMVP